MKKLALLLTLTFLYVHHTTAQEDSSFFVEVSTDSLLFGNFVEVTFTLENANMEEFQPPAFEGFKIIGGPNQASSMSIVNGQRSQRISYSYYLEPLEVGNYFIAPAFAVTSEQTLESQPIEVLVVPNPEGIMQYPEKEKPQENFMDDFFNKKNHFFFQPKKEDSVKKKRKVYKL